MDCEAVGADNRGFQEVGLRGAGEQLDASRSCFVVVREGAEVSSRGASLDECLCRLPAAMDTASICR